MTTPDATPRSWGAGINSLSGRLLHRGVRRTPQDGVSSPGGPPAQAARNTSRHPEAASSPARSGGRLLSWPRFPDAVIKLALAAPEADTRAAPKAQPAPAAPGTAEPEDAPVVSPAPAKPPAQPRSAAKTPPRPDRSPSPPAAVQDPPRISGCRTRRRAPFAVHAAVLLILAAGVLHLVASLQAALDPQRPVPQAAVQLQELGVPVAMVFLAARIADIAVASVAFGIYLLLASLIRDGRNWARTGVCVLVAAGLFFGFRDGSFPHVAAALVTALGAGLLFLPSSARYLATYGGRTA